MHPKELLLEIFKKSEYDDILELSLLNKTFNSVYKNELRWKYFFDLIDDTEFRITFPLQNNTDNKSWYD